MKLPLILLAALVMSTGGRAETIATGTFIICIGKGACSELTADANCSVAIGENVQFPPHADHVVVLSDGQPRHLSHISGEIYQAMLDEIEHLNLTPFETIVADVHLLDASVKWNKACATESTIAFPEHLSDEARRIITSTVQPGAIISIVNISPAVSDEFTKELADALTSVRGVTVAVGHFYRESTRQVEVRVEYDPKNPVTSSVFDALTKAGFNTVAKDPEIPNSSVAYILIGEPLGNEP